MFIVGSQAVDMAVMVGAYNGGSPPEHVPPRESADTGVEETSCQGRAGWHEVLPRRSRSESGPHDDPAHPDRDQAVSGDVDDQLTLRSGWSRSVEGPGEAKHLSGRRVGPLPI